MRVAPLLALMAAVPSISFAEPAPYTCSYFAEPRIFSEGRCRLVDGDDGGRYMFTTTVGAVRVKVVELSRQGQWSRVLINGKPGAGYEINREHRAYTSDDLTVSFEYARP